MKVRVQTQIIFAIFSSSAVGIWMFEIGHSQANSVCNYKRQSCHKLILNTYFFDPTNIVPGMYLKRFLIFTFLSLNVAAHADLQIA